MIRRSCARLDLPVPELPQAEDIDVSLEGWMPDVETIDPDDARLLAEWLRRA